ncbi:MAG TPA: hypothetical protein VI197_35145, partial [Polyangiaceae bacterium]
MPSRYVLFSLVLGLGLTSACRKHEDAPRGAAKPAPKLEETCDADGWCVQKAPGKSLCAVWAASPTDVWAAGTIVAHWDGVRWSEVKGTPGREPPGDGCLLEAIHGIGPMPSGPLVGTSRCGSRLVVTQYDDLNQGVKESEQTGVSVDASGIAISGPGCAALLPLKST